MEGELMNNHFPRLCVLLFAALSVSAAYAATPSSNTDDPAIKAGVDSSSALVQLKGDPLATSPRTRPPQGKKIDFNSSTVKSERARLAALRNDFKAWLRANAPKARVTGEFDISLNAVAVRLNGTSLNRLRAAPMVTRVELQGLYYPTIADPDLSIIHAEEAWAAGGGPANAGEGVKVAIVDSGIDIRHPCFSDAGYASQAQLGDRRFTNNKVIAAKVFNNKTPQQNFTPEAIDSHGTHVAGTAACNHATPATVSGVDIPYDMSGVAPRALLGNYNVFPADTASARSEDIVNALESAYADGFDIANMSLGGGASGILDLLTIAVDNLDQANMVVAVAAGNSGPGHFTIESPGSAARALTAGMSTVPHFVGAPVTVAGSTHGAASGEFEVVEADLTAALGVVEGTTNGLSNACTALGVNLSGAIALVSRGVCTFSTKIRNAQSAGAIAVLVANNQQGDPTAMGSDGTANQPTIPAYMVSIASGQAIKGSDGAATTISASLAYFLTPNVDFMAALSSQGPTDVDFRVKPDVVAPGVNVLSSIPVAFCEGDPCFAFFLGTSMATPHLAGSAAIVRSQRPQLDASEVRSTIVNTADQGVLKTFDTGAVVTDPQVGGAGRENLLSAVNARVALDPVSVTFGAVPSGSGQTRTVAVEVKNLGAAATFGVSIGAGSGGVAFSVSPASLTLGSGETGVATVTMTAAQGAAGGDHSAILSVVTGGAEVAHAVAYTFVK
jgi:minor extracellular serine protease Vpr